ncbi:hypothetical protein GCM10010191_50520 [Actinomadura vinacea]|uniref:DUF1700 domain-containing protein n=1 Tax=Actinomadura vinacea TaxID=115336 RepID=A0ABN3JHP3_9ACTN
MTTTDQLIADYLDRLDAAARDLPEARRADLLAEIREHITVALAESADRTEVGVPNVLDRLGDPVEIVREAAGDAGAVAPVRTHRRGILGAFGVAGVVTALLLVVAGVFVPVIGTIVGAALVWLLAPWPARHKLLVAVAWPVGLGMGGWFAGPGASESATCTPDGACTTDGLPIEAQMGLGLAMMIGAVLATALVIRHDRRKADTGAG